MNILQFTKRFQDEQSCIDYLKDLRMKQGIRCKKCNDKTRHYWLGSVNKFQCSVCRSRTNLKSGTVMEKSKLPLRIWFMTIHLMTSIKKSFSTLELQRQLGISCYESVWYMVMKIRIVMGKRDSLYKLNGDIEIDEGFFKTVVDIEQDKWLDEQGNLKVKRGRGTLKSKVLVMTESRPINHNLKHKKKRVLGYIKMVKMDGLTMKDINYEIRKGIDSNSTLYSDKYKGYNSVKSVVKEHYPEVVEKKQCMEKLPWVHTMISNSKKMVRGVHHSVNDKYLQNYLNEFCYKLNRRNFEYRDNFDGLMLCSSETIWY